MDWNKLIDAAHEANKADGINVRGGKKYLTVALRMDLFRRTFGAWGVETEILHLGKAKGEPVVMCAIIKDETGRVVGMGHAFEVIGAGNVNSTSALENAETSAVGRALACIGIHGGEYASANEMDAVGRKRDAMAEALSDARDDAVEDAGDTPKDRALAARDMICADLAKMKTIKGLNQAWDKWEKHIQRLADKYPEWHGDCLQTYTTTETAINEANT